MAGTEWFTHYTTDSPRAFLLVDGTVVPEPELEESKSRIKVRVKGDRKDTFYRRDKEKAVRHGISKACAKAKANFWMPIDLNDTALQGELGFDPTTKRAVFDPAQPINAGNLERSVAWWSFKHPTMPIKAVLTVKLYKQSIGGTENYSVIGRVAFPRTVGNPTSLHAQTVEEFDADFPATKVDWSDDYDLREMWDKFVRKNPAEWADGILGKTDRNLTERKAVEILARKVRRAEELDRITIPDLRDSESPDPAWLELELHDTNVTGRYLSDLKEYLDGTAGVERAVEIYQELVDCMRSIGMVMSTTLTTNDFLQALLTGDQEALTVRLGRATNDDDYEDMSHIVSVHLPTGTFVVTCSNDRDDKIAHAWDEARLLADLTGKKDVLLAYAEAHAGAEHTRRTKVTIGKRTTAPAAN